MVGKKSDKIKKAIVFDASTLISFSMNGLYPELKRLRKKFDGKFLITKDVWHEIVEKPLDIKKFKLEALRAKELIKEGILEFPDSVRVDEESFSDKTEEFLKSANSLYFDQKGEKVELIQRGEASCAALIRELQEKNFEVLFAVDERTMRMLIEKPKKLKDYLKRKLHTSVKMNKKSYEKFKGINVIRSTELIYIAYEKDVVSLKDGRNVLDGLLYAMKFKGCSITGEEIKKIIKMYKKPAKNGK